MGLLQGLPLIARLRWFALGACALLLLWFMWPARSDDPSGDQTPPGASANGREPATARNETKAPPGGSGARPLPPMMDKDGPARVSAMRAAFDRESPDATATEAEGRIRAVFAKQENADRIFRDVTCKRSVCQLSLNWSPELSPAYNQGLIEVVHEFTKEMSFEPDGEPTDTVPMRVLVARPGYSVQSLLEEERRLGGGR